jgi:hypothetical protein
MQLDSVLRRGWTRSWRAAGTWSSSSASVSTMVVRIDAARRVSRTNASSQNHPHTGKCGQHAPPERTEQDGSRVFESGILAGIQQGRDQKKPTRKRPTFSVSRASCGRRDSVPFKWVNKVASSLATGRYEPSFSILNCRRDILLHAVHGPMSAVRTLLPAGGGHVT